VHKSPITKCGYQIIIIKLPKVKGAVKNSILTIGESFFRMTIFFIVDHTNQQLNLISSSYLRYIILYIERDNLPTNFEKMLTFFGFL